MSLVLVASSMFVGSAITGGDHESVKNLGRKPPIWPIFKNGTVQSIRWITHRSNPRFAVYNAGTPHDKKDDLVWDGETGLVWERSPSTQFRTWLEAMGDCYSKIAGDRLGWRLPTIEELASLVDPTRSSPPFLPSGHPFTNVQSGGQYYWSSTSLFSTPPNAFAMRPYNGNVLVDIKAIRDNLVWCVRGGYGHSPDVLSE
jgi:hypothetical protein